MNFVLILQIELLTPFVIVIVSLHRLHVSDETVCENATLQEHSILDAVSHSILTDVK